MSEPTNKHILIKHWTDVCRSSSEPSHVEYAYKSFASYIPHQQNYLDGFLSQLWTIIDFLKWNSFARATAIVWFMSIINGFSWNTPLAWQRKYWPYMVGELKFRLKPFCPRRVIEIFNCPYNLCKMPSFLCDYGWACHTFISVRCFNTNTCTHQYGFHSKWYSCASFVYIVCRMHGCVQSVAKRQCFFLFRAVP